MGEERLRLGAAKCDVTPPTGLWMAGYGGREEPADGTHLPLWARASVCAEGNVRAALVVVDVVGINQESTNGIRESVRAETGIPASHILIATTHTHAGPVTTKFRDVSPDPGYMTQLSEGIVEAASKASEMLVPVRMGSAQTQVTEFHFNRRNADQPIDSTLDLIRFVDDNGASVATWMSYGCHPTNLTGANLKWSTDYTGVICDALESEWGAESAFFIGCHGDVGPHRPETTFAEVDRMGSGIARAAAAAAEGMSFDDLSGLRAHSELIAVPLADAPDLDSLKEKAKDSGGPGYGAAWAQDQIRMREAGDPAQTEIDVEFQGFQIGDLYVICFPGQMFGTWGLELRDRWPGGRLVIVNQANAHAGYFPSRVGYERGGYEVDSAFMFNSDLPAPMTWEAGQKLVDAALRFAEDS
ncbi:MAG: neutral/alkaline non-lysosomal ceramidase N-terminal domain-containing protein [Candidatus Latescibacteria bacterium]|jgi:hypothetical protein|nr:neutral/alkaline non-lysosomal ceramidase N-terminal domain-containing protein [Candidatus Latescibacterota bacterium]